MLAIADSGSPFQTRIRPFLGLKVYAVRGEGACSLATVTGYKTDGALSTPFGNRPSITRYNALSCGQLRMNRARSRA